MGTESKMIAYKLTQKDIMQHIRYSQDLSSELSDLEKGDLSYIDYTLFNGIYEQIIHNGLVNPTLARSTAINIFTTYKLQESEYHLSPIDNFVSCSCCLRFTDDTLVLDRDGIDFWDVTNHMTLSLQNNFVDVPNGHFEMCVEPNKNKIWNTGQNKKIHGIAIRGEEHR
jgi:hypothetical protein